jgi:hypothetical protein
MTASYTLPSKKWAGLPKKAVRHLCGFIVRTRRYSLN